jgi:hypothetical protein
MVAFHAQRLNGHGYKVVASMTHIVVSERTGVHVAQGEDRYEYQLHPGDPKWGGGWHLFLYKNGAEVGRGFYPSAHPLIGDPAYTEAYEYGRAWVASRTSPNRAEI